MKKTVSIIIALVLILAYAMPALATSKLNSTLTSSSTTSSSGWHGMTISRDAWTASGNARWLGSDASGVTLTVRPYSDDEYNYRMSLAYSYSKTELTGGQTYELFAYPIYVKYNSNTSGVEASLKADWHF